MRDHCTLAASGLALVMLGACDLVPDNHRGKVLIDLDVTVIDSIGAVSSRPIHLGVSWFLDPFIDDAVLELEITGTLPATVKLPIYKYPPLTELHSGATPTEPRLGVGYLTAWVPDEVDQFAMIGMSQKHWVIYVPDPVPEGSFASKLLHGTPPTGFHIYARRDFDWESRNACYDALPEPRTWQAIYDICGGHGFYDEIHLAPADLATPLSIDLGEPSGEPGVLWHSI